MGSLAGCSDNASGAFQTESDDCPLSAVGVRSFADSKAVARRHMVPGVLKLTAFCGRWVLNK